MANPLLGIREVLGGTGWSFIEFTKRAGDFAIAAAAVTLDVAPGNNVSRARIALGGVAERPIRCARAEAALVGAAGGSEAFQAAASMAIQHLDPPSDVHGSGAFRQRIAGVLVERALAEAWRRATGDHAGLAAL